MAVAYGKRFAVQFDEVFPEGSYVVGEVTAVTEYPSQEDQATRNQPIRPRIDDATVRPSFKVMITDPSADKDQSVTAEITSGVPLGSAGFVDVRSAAA